MNFDVFVLVALVFVFAGGIKGLIGFGLPTVSIAILAAFLGLIEAMTLMLLPSLIYQPITRACWGSLDSPDPSMLVPVYFGSRLYLAHFITVVDLGSRDVLSDSRRSHYRIWSSVAFGRSNSRHLAQVNLGFHRLSGCCQEVSPV